MVHFGPIRISFPRAERLGSFTSVSYEQGLPAEPVNPDAYHHLLFPHLYIQGLAESEVAEYRRRLWEQWNAEGVIQHFDAPRVWLYRQASTEGVSEGWVGGFSVDDYRHRRIRKHENIFPDKARRIADYFHQLGINGSPVLMIHPPQEEIAELRRHVQNRHPFFTFDDERGIRHTVWEVTPDEVDQLQRAFAPMPAVYIGDGHHRCQAYSEYYRGRSGMIMAFATTPRQVRVYPFHRLVYPLEGVERSALYAVFEMFFGAPVDADIPLETLRLGPGEVGICEGGRVTVYAAAGRRPEVEQVDEALHELRRGTSMRVRYLNGRLPADRLCQLAESERGMLVLVPPMRLAQVFEYADAGKTLPPKATWIEPKMRSGLFLHRL